MSWTDHRDKLRPLGPRRGITAVVAGAAAVGTELVISGGGSRLGRRSVHGRHGMMDVGGGFVTVRARGIGMSLRGRWTNAVLSYRGDRREQRRGERRQEEH